MHFAGVELSGQGVATGQRIRQRVSLPAEITDFAQDFIVDATAHQRVGICQGNAQTLPFPTDSFDVVVTVVALEAMEEIRHAALRELARVARQYVIMVEPFLDFNAEGVRYYHHAGQNYFQAKVNDLSQDGLEPLVVYPDVPHKLRLWPALVIARPV